LGLNQTLGELGNSSLNHGGVRDFRRDPPDGEVLTTGVILRFNTLEIFLFVPVLLLRRLGQ